MLFTIAEVLTYLQTIYVYLTNTKGHDITERVSNQFNVRICAIIVMIAFIRHV